MGLYVNLGGDNPGSHLTFVGRRSNGFRVSGQSWVEIRDFTIRRTDDNGIYFLSGASNGVIEGNTVTLSGAAGIAVVGSTSILVESNVTSYNHSHGIYLRNLTTDSTVTNNESFGNRRVGGAGTNGIKVEGSSDPNTPSPCERILVKNNRLHDNQDTGLQINFSNDNLSLNNRSWNNGDHGFDHLNGMGNIHSGDVAWGNHNDGFSFEAGATNSVLLNSIAAGNGLTTGRFELLVDNQSLTGFISDYNILWKPNSDPLVRYTRSRPIRLSWTRPTPISSCCPLPPPSIRATRA
jgi:parallel beta-helix repeat protein